MEATYISTNSFSVLEDRTAEFIENRRLKIDCGVDGLKYATVVSSSFSTLTTVVIDESILTSNLVDVLYSVVKSGADGNLPNHYHSSVEGDGGPINIELSFVDLIDTPTTYSGGSYLRSTTSGIVYDGIIVVAPDSSEWLIRVTSSGTLYTTLLE